MNYNQFYNLSCYEEFEIRSALTGISKVDVLYRIGHLIDNYFCFVSEDGIFNWFDLKGNHVEDPGVLKEFEEKYISTTITKCIIPDSVTSINNYAFAFCKSLKEITIPERVKNIGNRAFYYCDLLTSITIPDNVISIGSDAFSCCISLTSITIPNSVTSIGEEVFRYCTSLKEVIFKGKTLEEVKQLESYPFGIKDESVFKFS